MDPELALQEILDGTLSEMHKLAKYFLTDRGGGGGAKGHVPPEVTVSYTKTCIFAITIITSLLGMRHQVPVWL